MKSLELEGKIFWRSFGNAAEVQRMKCADLSALGCRSRRSSAPHVGFLLSPCRAVPSSGAPACDTAASSRRSLSDPDFFPCDLSSFWKTNNGLKRGDGWM